MPRKNTLKIAQRQALNIHLSIALMERPLKIWEQVDDLLHTLTGVPKFTEDQDFREPPPPPPTTIIIEALKPHHDGLTRHTLSKQTGLAPDTAQGAIDELISFGKVEPVKRQGWKRYALVKPGRPREDMPLLSE